MTLGTAKHPAFPDGLSVTTLEEFHVERFFLEFLPNFFPAIH